MAAGSFSTAQALEGAGRAGVGMLAGEQALLSGQDVVLRAVE
jgi:hypothetical protein